MEKVLTVLEYTEKEQEVTQIIGTLQQITTLKQETLFASVSLNARIVYELMALRDWYIEWQQSAASETQTIPETFTLSMWDDYILQIALEEKRERDNPKTATTNTGKAPTTTHFEGFNTSCGIKQYGINQQRLDKRGIPNPAVAEVEGSCDVQTNPDMLTELTNSTTTEVDLNNNIGNNKTDQQREAKSLPLVNGGFVMGNMTFQLSHQVPKHMSTTSSQQQIRTMEYYGNDTKTKINNTGRAFCMNGGSGQYADRADLANHLIKKNTPISSGLTHCVNNTNKLKFLLGMHKPPNLKNNRDSLLSTKQSQEEGIWLSNILQKHGGAQQLVVRVEQQGWLLNVTSIVKVWKTLWFPHRLFCPSEVPSTSLFTFTIRRSSWTQMKASDIGLVLQRTKATPLQIGFRARTRLLSRKH